MKHLLKLVILLALLILMSINAVYASFTSVQNNTTDASEPIYLAAFNFEIPKINIPTIEPITITPIDPSIFDFETPEIDIPTIKSYVATSLYIYDAETPEIIDISGLIGNVKTVADAKKHLYNFISNMSENEKKFSTNIDYLTLFSEEVSSSVNSIPAPSNVTIDSNNVNTTLQSVKELNNELLSIMNNNDIAVERTARNIITYDVGDNDSFDIQKDEKFNNVDEFKIKSDFVSVSVKGNEDVDMSVRNESNQCVSVNFDTNKTSCVKVSFPGMKDDGYLAVVDSNGNIVGGKYNPATEEIEAKITESGVYSVVYNEKDFEDIKEKSNEMQKSIKMLASKGIINGTSMDSFSPDDNISRAEIAALILRTLSKLDPNADGEFSDVTRSNWYFGAAGSSKKYGIINGFEDNTFRGDAIITKDQVVVVTARVLKNEMQYKAPADIMEYLPYPDATSIPEWAKEDIAIANMANLIMDRIDNLFVSEDKMTRGDAAIILYRLFNKIW